MCATSCIMFQGGSDYQGFKVGQNGFEDRPFGHWTFGDNGPPACKAVGRTACFTLQAGERRAIQGDRGERRAAERSPLLPRTARALSLATCDIQLSCHPGSGRLLREWLPALMGSRPSCTRGLRQPGASRLAAARPEAYEQLGSVKLHPDDAYAVDAQAEHIRVGPSRWIASLQKKSVSSLI